MLIGKYAIAIIIMYFYGAIPFSYLIGKMIYGKNILEEGSKNSGGSNLGRVCGKQAFILGFVADASKGVVACLLGWSLGLEPAILLLVALIGHSFSCFLNFKGGKGVAAACGFVLVYSFWGAVLALIVFFIVLYLKKYVSLASITAIFAYFLYTVFWENTFYAVLIFILFLAVAALHRDNIQRIRDGVENKITWM